MNGTLPLFDELELPGPAGPRPAASQPGDDAARAGKPPRASSEPSAQVEARERHLRAAWRLSRVIQRLPDHSPEQTRVGVAICRHLQALLAQAEDA